MHQLLAPWFCNGCNLTRFSACGGHPKKIYAQSQLISLDNIEAYLQIFECHKRWMHYIQPNEHSVQSNNGKPTTYSNNTICLDNWKSTSKYLWFACGTISWQSKLQECWSSVPRSCKEYGCFEQVQLCARMHTRGREEGIVEALRSARITHKEDTWRKNFDTKITLLTNKHHHFGHS